MSTQSPYKLLSKMHESLTIEPTTTLHLLRPQPTHKTFAIHGVFYQSLPQLLMRATLGTRMHEFGERMKKPQEYQGKRFSNPLALRTFSPPQVIGTLAFLFLVA